MSPALLADAVLLLHGLFIVWAVFGGLAVWWRARMAWLHLPALAWAAWVEFSGSICPLTPLEQSLRLRAGQAGYEGGFIERYLAAAIYPEGLTPRVQVAMGALLLVFNLWVYWRAFARRRRIA